MGENVFRDHKARLFAFIYGREENKKWTLSLYNAVNGTDYDDPSEVEINTLEDTVYMGMKNDLSFIIRSDLSLYEQQSSYNPNMPVRQLMYLGKIYDKYIKTTGQNIYSEKRMTLPLPKLMTFYNGQTDASDCVLRLSDSFPKECDPEESDVEVQVHMINIRPGHGSCILDKCKTLAEYSWFIEEIRNNRKNMELEAAVDRAIHTMPSDYEIKGFLEAHSAEVKNMCITEYNEAETMQMFKEEWKKEGIAIGEARGNVERQRLQKENDDLRKKIAELEAAMA